jgi:hypothetical protein
LKTGVAIDAKLATNESFEEEEDEDEEEEDEDEDDDIL